MLSATRSRIPSLAARITKATTRSLSTTTTLRASENTIPTNDPAPAKETPNVSKTNELAVDAIGTADKSLVEMESEAEKIRQLQAPNRKGVWSRSQMPRAAAMTGPRFEQTIMETQPQPYAAIELIHTQPVRWVHDKVVSCDGGGGPLGHPKIFINTDKPQICQCTYCGLPYANEHHKKHLEAQASTPYPLKSSGTEVKMPATPSQMGTVY